MLVFGNNYYKFAENIIKANDLLSFVYSIS